jgi:hypothetical protein
MRSRIAHRSDQPANQSTDTAKVIPSRVARPLGDLPTAGEFTIKLLEGSPGEKWSWEAVEPVPNGTGWRRTARGECGGTERLWAQQSDYPNQGRSLRYGSIVTASAGSGCVQFKGSSLRVDAGHSVYRRPVVQCLPDPDAPIRSPEDSAPVVRTRFSDD